MNNFIVKDKTAFLDSVAAGTPLKTPAQAQSWLESLKDKGVTTLFILTSGGKYYKLVSGSPVKASTKAQFDAEFTNLAAKQEKTDAAPKKADDSNAQKPPSINRDEIYQEVYATVQLAAKQALSDLFSKLATAGK
jgi:hypothetical protein